MENTSCNSFGLAIESGQKRSVNLPQIHRSQRKFIPQVRLNSPRFKHLRKLYFQYKANAKVLTNSPYYSNHQEQQNLVQLITSHRYDVSAALRNDLRKQVKDSSTVPITDRTKKTISVNVLFLRKTHTLSISAQSVAELNFEIKCELAYIEHSTLGSSWHSNQIICFETIKQDRYLDYFLSCPTLEIKWNQLQLQPVFAQPIASKVSLADFDLMQCLGSGGFSLVYLARAKFNGRFYAMKLIDKQFILSNGREGIVENERFILQELKSHYVTTLKFAFQSASFFIFVVEYCPGGELFEQLRKVRVMTEAQAKFYFLEILVALDYIHSQNIIYRDLKPENLLIAADGHIKIADFGLSKPMVDSPRSYSFCGSPEYMAPEMLLKEGHDFTLDYYCLGALLYELVLGLPPFYSSDQEKVYNSILNDELTFSGQLSAEIRDLLSKLLHKDANQRLGRLYGIKEILLHPWVGKASRQKIENRGLTPPFLPQFGLFNFGSNNNRDKCKQTEEKIAADRQLHFQSHFNQKFYYQSEEEVKECPQKARNIRKRSTVTLEKYRQRSKENSERLGNIRIRKL